MGNIANKIYNEEKISKRNKKISIHDTQIQIYCSVWIPFLSIIKSMSLIKSLPSTILHGKYFKINFITKIIKAQ